MFWWGLAAIVLIVPVLAFEFIYWCSKDPAIDREVERKIGKELFQAEQDYRAKTLWQKRLTSDVDCYQLVVGS